MQGIGPNVLAVGGGKGPIGKSLVASTVAAGLALRGYDTVLADADFTGYSIPSLFLYGIKNPDLVLGDYMVGRADSIDGVLMPTLTENLSLLCGAGDLIEVTNPRYSQREKLARGLAGLEADFLVVDLGGETGLSGLDFFNMAGLGIVVSGPGFTSAQNAYKYLRLAFTRKLISMFSDCPLVLDMLRTQFMTSDCKGSISLLIERVEEKDGDAAMKLIEAVAESNYRLVVNMAGRAQGDKLSGLISEMAEQYLSVSLGHAGTVEVCEEMEALVKAGAPIELEPGSRFAAMLGPVLDGIVSDERLAVRPILKEPAHEGGGGHAAPPSPAPCRTQPGINSNVNHSGKVFHVQTEDLGVGGGKIVTHVFSEGRILFTKATEYGRLVGSGDMEQAIRERIKWQHQVVVAGISRDKLCEAPVPSGAVS